MMLLTSSSKEKAVSEADGWCGAEERGGRRAMTTGIHYLLGMPPYSEPLLFAVLFASLAEPEPG